MQLEDSPPRRSHHQLEAWVRGFEEQTRCVAGTITVAPQEDEGREDTGLVILRLRNADASISMKPRGYDDPLWETTLTGWHSDLTMSVHDVAGLAAELVVAGNLCAFLQWKALEWDRKSGQHNQP